MYKTNNVNECKSVKDNLLVNVFKLIKILISLSRWTTEVYSVNKIHNNLNSKNKWTSEFNSINLDIRKWSS